MAVRRVNILLNIVLVGSEWWGYQVACPTAEEGAGERFYVQYACSVVGVVLDQDRFGDNGRSAGAVVSGAHAIVKEPVRFLLPGTHQFVECVLGGGCVAHEEPGHGEHRVFYGKGFAIDGGWHTPCPPLLEAFGDALRDALFPLACHQVWGAQEDTQGADDWRVEVNQCGVPSVWEWVGRRIYGCAYAHALRFCSPRVEGTRATFVCRQYGLEDW